ncbi:MAG: hypothetical protein AAF467_16105 [Actinomycetota bacterium]
MAASTLAQALEPVAVGFDELEAEYKPMLKLVEQLIGVVPNHERYFAIWHPGFRTMNLLVPNLLNLPAALFGQGAPKDLVGLVMYASSFAAGCMYCTAHSCSFALRRGIDPETLAGNHGAPESAVYQLATVLGHVPSDIIRSDITDLEKHFDADDIEWFVLAAGLMGFLNKFMDSMGMQLEDNTIADVQDLIAPLGWTPGQHKWDEERVESNEEVPVDSIRTYARVIRQAPGAVRTEGKWTKGLSGQTGRALMALEDHAGYAFPILASLRHSKAVKAIAAALRENLTPETSEIGMGAKCLAGLVYARVADNEMLSAEMIMVAQNLAPDLPFDTLVSVGLWAEDPTNERPLPDGLDRLQAATVMLAKSAATSPTSMTEISVQLATERLTPPQIIETVTWLAVCQLLNRLYAFYDARIGLTV